MNRLAFLHKVEHDPNIVPSVKPSAQEPAPAPDQGSRLSLWDAGSRTTRLPVPLDTTSRTSPSATSGAAKMALGGDLTATPDSSPGVPDGSKCSPDGSWRLRDGPWVIIGGLRVCGARRVTRAVDRRGPWTDPAASDWGLADPLTL